MVKFELVGHSAGKPPPVKFHCFVVDSERPAADFELEIELPEVEIGLGDVGDQGDQHAALSLLGGKEDSGRRFRFAPNPAEDIQLPGHIENHQPVLESAVGAE